MIINRLAVVTPSSIYHVCSIRNTLREEKFTPGESTPMNMKICVRHNVRKHREINNGENCITLDIFLQFGSMDKMEIAYLYPKNCLER